MIRKDLDPNIIVLIIGIVIVFGKEAILRDCFICFSYGGVSLEVCPLMSALGLFAKAMRYRTGCFYFEVMKLGLASSR